MTCQTCFKHKHNRKICPNKNKDKVIVIFILFYKNKLFKPT